jgi:hypothetical protein
MEGGRKSLRRFQVVRRLLVIGKVFLGLVFLGFQIEFELQIFRRPL